MSGRWWRAGLLVVATLVSAGVLLLVTWDGNASVLAVQVADDGRALRVTVDTCNADVSVDVEEYSDQVVLRPKHHDWYRYLFGSNDCADGVWVELDAVLGDRIVTNSSGDELDVGEP